MRAVFEVFQETQQGLFLARVKQEAEDQLSQADQEQGDNGAVNDKTRGGELVAEIHLVDEVKFPDQQAQAHGSEQDHAYEHIEAETAPEL